MLLTKLLLLPFAVASTVTVYIHPIPDTTVSKSSIIPSPVPLAQIEYDPDLLSTSTATATVTSYTPPKGTYSPEHLLRIGLLDNTKSWKGVVTSAASFGEDYKQKFIMHVDEKGQVYHVGFSAVGKIGEAGDKEGPEVEVVKREAGPKPVLNKPVVLNAEGKIDSKEPEKTFLQKYWWAIGLFLLVQVVAGGKD